ncbi:MAG: hypothetical protein ACD_58C00172G0002 [uncultured bacterium]|nr:MAG: hypothetical protein ACD_58C00172G0002 [uncultured bacterium]
MKQCNSVTISRLLRNRGFTLIELIIYSGILVIVLTFTGEYLYSIGQARINNAARVEVAQAAQLILNRVKYDVVNSQTIVTPAGTQPSSSLSLNVGENLITYYLNEDILDRDFNDVADRLSSNQTKVSDLSFNRIANPSGNTTIQMRFTLTSQAQLTGGRNVQASFQTTFSQR